MHRRHSSDSGQIALAILLIMAVVLVISLSVASRTTRDIAQTIETSSAARVFSQAESGAEQQLNAVLTALHKSEEPQLGNFELPGDDAFARTATSSETTLSQQLPSGGVAQVILDLDGDGTSDYSKDSIRITWAEGEADTKASLIISQYYWDNGQVQVRYSFVAPCNGLQSGDGFNQPDLCGAVTDPSVLIYPVSSSTSIIRVQAVYNNTDLIVTGVGGEDLPPQQYKIRSEAVSNSNDIQQNSAIEVTTTHLIPPPFLDYSLYSGAGDIAK